MEPQLAVDTRQRAGLGGVPLTINPRVFPISPGTHTLLFRTRNRGTGLDRVIVTNDMTFVPTEGDVDAFPDVPPSNSFYDFIENVARNDITTGLRRGMYCPASSVTRAQMAVMLLKSEHGSSWTPPPATGTVFSDVPASAFAASWIEALAAEGITTAVAAGGTAPLPRHARAYVRLPAAADTAANTRRLRRPGSSAIFR